jgi:hypothetical protein
MAFSLFGDGPRGGSGTPVWPGVLQAVAFYSFELIPSAVSIAILAPSPVRKLRDRVDLDSLNAELVDVLTRTMQPGHVSVWLKTSSS